MIIIGIDPGKSGAVSIWDDGIKKVVKCPPTPQKMANLIRSEINNGWIDDNKDIHIYIEKVWSMPHDGKVSIFTFAKNYGEWLGICGAFNIEPKLVAPVVWQKHFNKKLPKEKSKRKKKLKEISEQYTEKKVYLYSADAILISIYGFIKEQERVNGSRE
jgi:hypothetical protein